MRPPLARLVALLAVSTLLAGVAITQGRAVAQIASFSSTRCEADRNPIPDGVAAELAARYPGRRFSAAVLDNNGCAFDLHPELRLTTASVLKIEIMVGVMLRAQREGRGLSQWERDQIWPMITESANAPANALWSSLGGAPGMEAIDAEVGLTDTVHASPVWGITTTSAADQARFMRQVWTGDGSPLTPELRAEARGYLTSVVPSQRWGATASVPVGWTVGQKNGFAPASGLGWRLNTVGWVERPDGTGWAVVVLSDGWSTEAEGIAAVHELAGRINAAMLEPPYTGPGVVATAEGRLDFFSRLPWGATVQLFRTPGSPLGATAAGGLASSDLDGVARPTPSTPPEAIARGLDGQPWRFLWNGAAWIHQPLGGLCSSGPTATYSGPGRYDAFCRGLDGQLWTRSWDVASGWTGWYPLGGRLSSDPDATSPGQGGVPTVFARGLDGAVWQYFQYGGAWHVHSLGGYCTSGPAATMSGASRADVFCRGGDGQLWWNSWLGAGWWVGWSPLGGLLASDPDADSGGAEGPLVVAARGLDQAVWTYTQVGGSWQVARQG